MKTTGFLWKLRRAKKVPLNASIPTNNFLRPTRSQSYYNSMT